jgi:hypothetical protein
VEDGQAVERALGPQLLAHADGGVEEEDEAEGGIGQAAGGQHGQVERGEDGVEAGEDVGPQDLQERAAGAVVDGVDLSGHHPLRHLLGGQADRGGVRRGEADRGVSAGRVGGAPGRRRGGVGGRRHRFASRRGRRPWPVRRR